MIKAEILADSESPSGKRITTFLITYPRFILAEVNTHRMLSRNSASSRAIPISKMIASIWKTPAMPVSWGVNGKGMQAKGELAKHRAWIAGLIWQSGCMLSCLIAWLLSKVGVHKQLANRVTEPWAHMVTVVTATEWENFFALRAHPDAQPEFQELAYRMLEAFLESVPKRLNESEWHMPFVDDDVKSTTAINEALKIATARCARVSYTNHDACQNLKLGGFEADCSLHDRLLSSGHMSPFEHCAYPVDDPEEVHGNLIGWRPYRKLFAEENREMSREEMSSRLADWRQKSGK